MRRLIKNAAVLLRKDGKYTVLKDAYLGIDGKYIDYIGTEAPKDAYDEIKDMQGKLLMPGLVNTHGHAAMTMLRGVGSGLNLQDWLFKAIFPVEANLAAEDVVAGTEMAIMEMLASGTTCFKDMYFFPAPECKAVAASGMKMNIDDFASCPGELDERIKGRIRDGAALYDAWHGQADDRIHVDMAIHSEYLTSEAAIKYTLDTFGDRDCCFHVHVSETKKEHLESIQRHGLTPTAFLNSLGALEKPAYFAHCVWSTDEDLAIMKEKGVSLAHNPSSNMKLGSGFAPIPKAVDMGVNVCLGTDGCASNNNLNMFEELHLAALIHKGVACDSTVLTTDTLLDMATVNGARAMGRMDTGVLEVGKCADIIAVDLDKPHLMPVVDYPALLCYSAQGSDVVMTMVNGQILYENGEFFTMDTGRVKADFARSVRKLLGI